MNRLFQIILILILIGSCNPDRHLMPITTSSEEARVLFVQGRDYYENVHYQLSDSMMRLAIQMDSQFALAYLYLNQSVGLDDAKALKDQVSIGERLLIDAVAAILTNDLDAALMAIDSLVMLYPKDKYCLNRASRYYWRAGKMQKAEKFSRMAITLDPYYAAAHNVLAFELIESEQYEEAKEAFEDYIELWSDKNLGVNANTMDSYAEMLWLTSDYQAALEAYRKTMQIDSGWTQSYRQIIWIYIHLEDFEEAIAHCNELYEMGDREERWAVSMKANICLIRGDVDGALRVMDDYNEVCYEKSNLSRVVRNLYHKGWYAMRAGHEKQAIEIFHEGMSLLSDSSRQINDSDGLMMLFHGGLSVAYGQNDNMLDAETSLSRARAYFSDFSSITYFKSWMKTFEGIYEINMGNFDTAISILTPPGYYNPHHQFYLAKAYELRSDIEMAYKYYRKVTFQPDPLMTGMFYKESKEKCMALRNE